MKNIINKIILFAAVFFAAGLFNISANAQQTYGYYIANQVSPSAFWSRFWAATGYATAELAEDGAVLNCVENVGGTEEECRTLFTVNRGVFGGTEANQVVVWTVDDTIINFTGLGVDFAAAHADLLAKCAANFGNMAPCTANTNYAEANVLSCGAGSAEDATDDCRRREGDPVPLDCGLGTTFTDGDGDGNCDCATDAQFRIDAETCRSAESLEECMR